MSNSIFVPMDPMFPIKRLKYMAEDAGVSYCITTSQFEHVSKQLGNISVCIVLDFQEGTRDFSVDLERSNVFGVSFASVLANRSNMHIDSERFLSLERAENHDVIQNLGKKIAKCIADSSSCPGM